MISEGNVAAWSQLRGGNYPHLSRTDSIVWKWIQHFGLVQAQSWDYHVALGGAAADAVSETSPYWKAWSELNKKRVDVVGFCAKCVQLIEVKEIAGFAALGQLLGYRYLWEQERGGKPELILVAACVEVDADLAPVFPLYGIQVVQVPSDFRELVYEEIKPIPRDRASS